MPMPTLFQPLWIAPPERAGHVTPEKRLMIAILEEALLTLKKCEQNRKCFHEAREWLMSEEQAGPFSYRNICDVLELGRRPNPDPVRVPAVT